MFNPFDATGLFLYPLKTSENQRLKFKLKPERFTGEKSAENLILSNESKNLSND